MNPVALLTPTYGRDLELCTLLCESVDRHVTSFSKHYLLVPDCDLPLFAHFESERRIVLPASTVPARLAAAAAPHRSAQAAPVLVVAAGQAGERLACAAVPQDRRDHVAAAPALLHPRFRHRVLPGFRPVALRISESDSAAEHAGRGHRRPSRGIRAGSRPAISCSGCRRRRCRHRTSSATSSSGTSRPPARWPRGSRRPPGSTGSKRCAGPASSPNTCCTAISCRTTPRFAARPYPHLAHALRQLLGAAEAQQG